MSDFMKFNMNDKVKVKLTEHGRKVHREEHEKLFAGQKYSHVYSPPEEDSDGYSTWQMWQLMSSFGEWIYMGCAIPFDTNILVEKST